MLTEIESGITIPEDQLKTKLAFLKANVSQQEQEHYLRLQSVLCWYQQSDNEEQILTAIAFANEVLDLDFIKVAPEFLLDIQLCRAWLYEENGQQSLALEHYNEIVQQAYQINSPKLIADARSTRGGMYSFMGDFSLALEDFVTAQHLYENLGFSYWSLINLSDLATSYRRFGDPQTAIRYLKKLEHEFIELNDFDAANYMSTEMAFAYNALDDDVQALEHHLKSYQYWTKKNNVFNAATMAVNIAGNLINLNRITEAKIYLTEANISITSNDEAFYSYMKMFDAQVMMSYGNQSEALVNLSKSKLAFSRVKDSRGAEKVLLLESKIYTTLERWGQVARTLEQYILIHNKLDTRLQSNRTIEMRTRFDTDQVENENKRLITYQQMKEQEIHVLRQNKYLQLTIIILFIIILLIVSRFTFKQVQKSKLLTVMAMTDHLTTLPNRRQTYTAGEHLFSDKNKTLALILFDADHFKKVNDEFGHDVGDKVLVLLAHISRGLMRKSDIVGRVGGEEFLIVLPEVTLNQAMKIAENLVDTIANTDFTEFAYGLTMSISAGVVIQKDDKSFLDLFRRADIALYQAKAAGRNCAFSNTGSLV